MKARDFQSRLSKAISEDLAVLQDSNKDWVVKGFIDIYKNIYTISIDTKVVSKVIELMLFPTVLKFAKANALKMILAEHQNHYPDITFVDEADNTAFALDIKSTYRTDKNKVNGFTLGAFTGYFRNRASTKNITLPYNTYQCHFVLGVIYSQKIAE
ncbi:MAG: restriction endonuclease, partial [Kiritimatiellaeota bacterium]|nr:restriction endonuclease [Kiritimatiellota bacterium]